MNGHWANGNKGVFFVDLTENLNLNSKFAFIFVLNLDFVFFGVNKPWTFQCLPQCSQSCGLHGICRVIHRIDSFNVYHIKYIDLLIERSILCSRNSDF